MPVPFANALRATIAISTDDIIGALSQVNEEALRESVKDGLKDRQLFDKNMQDEINKNISQWAEISGKSINDSVYETVENIIQSGYRNDVSTQDLADQIDEYMSGKGELIARTEVNKALNTGKMMAYSRNGEKYKQWISKSYGDASARHDHEEFDDLGSVPIDHVYSSEKNGDIRFPGDVEASAGHLCNCRCVISEGVAPDEDEENQDE